MKIKTSECVICPMCEEAYIITIPSAGEINAKLTLMDEMATTLARIKRNACSCLEYIEEDIDSLLARYEAQK